MNILSDINNFFTKDINDIKILIRLKFFFLAGSVFSDS